MASYETYETYYIQSSASTTGTPTPPTTPATVTTTALGNRPAATAQFWRCCQCKGGWFSWKYDSSCLDCNIYRCSTCTFSASQ